MYTQYIVRPLYNGLIGIINALPFVDLGIAVIIFTVIVKAILFPLSKSALMTQLRMKEIEPEANRIRTQYANDRQVQAMKTMELYKAKGVKPFSGMLLLFIQLPILFALLSVFYKIIPEINTDLLYSFVSVPAALDTNFLGLIDLTVPSLFLAILTGIIQFLQLHFSLASRQAKKNPPVTGSNPTANMAHAMTTQMKYFVPLLAFASIYWIIPAQEKFAPAASIIAVYWITSSLMTLLQELYIARKHLK